jgi:hypothetical protein
MPLLFWYPIIIWSGICGLTLESAHQPFTGQNPLEWRTKESATESESRHVTCVQTFA